MLSEPIPLQSQQDGLLIEPRLDFLPLHLPLDQAITPDLIAQKLDKLHLGLTDSQRLLQGDLD